MKPNQPGNISFNPTWIVIIILLVSLVLRWALVLQGGQFYFSDEHRYEISREVAGFLVQGKVTEGLTPLFVSPEHLGFKIIGLLPALIEQSVRSSPRIPGLFFSLFSLFNLYLIFLLSRRMGATSRESLLALGLAAASQSLLYYARHLMPYDPAMTFGLLSLFIALKEKPTVRTSVLCGAFSFMCFITYNGYWTLAGFAMLCHVFTGEIKIATILQRGLLIAIGFAIPLVVVVISSAWVGINFLQNYAQFALSVTEGVYAEGWSLPFEYLWHTEYLLIVILGFLALFAILDVLRSKEKRPLVWITGALFVYLCLVIFSVFFHVFVVYGRLARQVMPFLILLAAYGFEQLSRRRTVPPYLLQIVLVGIAVQGLWNYRTSFLLSYPSEFASKAEQQYPNFQFSSKRMAFGAPVVCQNNGYAMQNAKYFLIAPEESVDIHGTVLLSHSHPINFLPYQYEGYKPNERAAFRAQNLLMVFYKVDDAFMSDKNPSWTEIKNCALRSDQK